MSRVLVVEDNPSNMTLVRVLLEHESHEVIEARDGAECKAALEAGAPDLILMDVQLPDTDGMTLTRMIRADARFSHLPVVAVTAFAMRGDEGRILSAGFDAFITKPIRLDPFLAILRRFLAAEGRG